MAYSPILPSEAQLPIPERVQRKIDIYRQAGFIWHPKKDYKDREEIAFHQVLLYDQSQEPRNRTLLNLVNQIYRVKDDRGLEWIVYTLRQICKNKAQKEETFDNIIGVDPVPVPYETVNDEGKVIDRYVKEEKPKFLIEWSKENFQKILDISDKEVTDFYVCKSTNNYKAPIANDKSLQAVGNKEDFINGTWDELENMPFKGYTKSTEPQLDSYRKQILYERGKVDEASKFVESQAQQQQQKIEIETPNVKVKR